MCLCQQLGTLHTDASSTNNSQREAQSTEEAGIPAPWTEIDKAQLIALRDEPIAMCDTVYGWFEKQKKRDVERAYQKMSVAEKDLFK